MPKFLTLIFIFIYNLSFADYQWNENCKLAYQSVIELKFEKANEIILNEKILNPNNSLVVLIEDYSDYLKIQIGEEKNDFNKLKNNKENRLKRIENENSDSPWHMYCQAEIHLHWAANRLKFGEYFTAAYEINKAYRLIESNNEKYPYFLPNKKNLGLIYSLIGSIPDKYNWILSFVVMQGNIQTGLKIMKSTIEEMKEDTSYSYMLEETYFLYAFLKMNLEHNENDLTQILNQIKDSEYLILKFAASRIATKLGQNELALSLLKNRDICDQCYPFYYLDYLTAIALQNALDKECINYFLSYLNNFNGQNYRKSALMHISWYYLINDDINNFNKYKEKIAHEKGNQVDADKEAQSFFENNFKPHKDLLIARLYFDGGYYKKAMKALQNINPKTISDNLKNILEYNYRYARTTEQLNQIDKAIEFYKKTIQMGSDEKFYFAAKSALQLAYIYEKQNDYAKAKTYFMSCIEMENHLYEQGIEQKAKAGLNRLP